jgi:NADH:ubiquinone oxidoreductase subunit F (NADH-binding)
VNSKNDGPPLLNKLIREHYHKVVCGFCTNCKEVLEELRKITKLLVVLVTEDMKQKDQIRNLDRVGFQPKEIAELIDTTPNTVRVALHDIRKKKK